MTNRIFSVSFASVYPYYIQKAKNKNRTQKEVDKIICWLTGYNLSELQKQIDNNAKKSLFG